MWLLQEVRFAIICIKVKYADPKLSKKVMKLKPSATIAVSDLAKKEQGDLLFRCFGVA